jgi:hypothetical protein
VPHPIAPKFTTASLATTLDAIDSLITDWVDWEAEDKHPNPKASELRQQFDAVRPILATTPAMATLLRDAQGAMQSLRHQVDQMSGMFPDEDGTIQEACDAHDETSEAIREVLDGLRPVPVKAPGMRGPG